MRRKKLIKDYLYMATNNDNNSMVLYFRATDELKADELLRSVVIWRPDWTLFSRDK